jgi:hypothetical protein
MSQIKKRTQIEDVCGERTEYLDLRGRENALVDGWVDGWAESER